MLIDTHCHLDFPDFDKDRAEAVKRANESGVVLVINTGSSLEGSLRSVNIAAEFPCVYATVGIHPHEADKTHPEDIGKIKELSSRDKVVAIGEIGLDYFKGYSSKENQRPLFISLLQVAKDTGLPVVIHTRDAGADTLAILKDFLPLKGVVVHCFSGEKAFLEECLSYGFMVSFTCNITYKKAENLRNLLKEIPLERLMLETDAPFLAPEGFRGRRNEPAFVKDLAEEVARIRGAEAGQIAEATTRNAKAFFNL